MRAERLCEPSSSEDDGSAKIGDSRPRAHCHRRSLDSRRRRHNRAERTAHLLGNNDEDLLCSSSGEEGLTTVDTGFTVVLSSPNEFARRRAARTPETSFGHGHDFLSILGSIEAVGFSSALETSLEKVGEVGGSVVMEQGDVRDHGGIDGSGDYEGETSATVTTPAITSDSATSVVQATAMTMEDGDGVELFGRGSEGVVTTTANEDCERADWNSDFLLAMSPSRDGSTRAAVPSPTDLGDGAMQFDTRASAQENGFSSPGQQQYSVRIPWAPSGSVSGFENNTFEAIGADGFKASLPTDRAAPISTSRNGRKPRSAEWPTSLISPAAIHRQYPG